MTPQGAMVGFGRGPAKMLCAFSAGLMALATAACNPVSDQYFREGAGSDLYSAQLAQATQLQDEYVYYICRQAGDHNLDASAGGSCDGLTWTAFTLAGMNDIDRRCDAYLDWLDAQRRDRTPILAQIGAMGGSAVAIMGVAGAGTQALSIVANAFGLAGTTYANWNSRLLLDVDHSTVQTIVYTRQRDFRKVNFGVIVPDRPAAIYLLRGYLRICMPITIETTINTNVTLVQNGVSPAVIQNMFLRKAVFGGGETRQAITAKQALNVPTGPVQPPPGLPGAETDVEKKISAPVLAQLKANVLCVGDTEEFDKTTRDGIRIFQATTSDKSPTGTVSSDPELQKMVAQNLGVPCPPRARNWWELTHFFPNGAENPDNVKELQHLLNIVLGASDPENGTLDDATRANIAKARGVIPGLQDVTKEASSAQWATPKFFTELRRKALKMQPQQNESQPK
jgi:hypothetical protein